MTDWLELLGDFGADKQAVHSLDAEGPELLYLVSIELDPEPQPVDKLRFDDLRGKVLYRVGSDTNKPALSAV
jgi:hypothetical protein